jgi:DNA-binding CsgD family transcriptional regulator
MFSLIPPPDLTRPVAGTAAFAGRTATGAAPQPLESLAEFVDEPWLGLAADGLLLGANRAARRLLEANEVLRVERGGRVAPVDATLAAGWRDALAEVRAGRRRLLWGSAPDARAIVMQPGGDAMPVVVRVGDDSIGRLRRLWAFAHSVGLSAQETRVLEGLVAGLGPADIAKRHEVAIATVRTQVRGVLSKTQVRGMRELLALVARVA